MQKKIALMGLFVFLLAGCATNSRYVNYTTQQFPPKDELYVVNVYPDAQSIAANGSYYVIGKVAVEGFASSGVNPEMLTNQARKIARKKGADVIINAKTEMFRYYGGDALLRFKGELIVYAPTPAGAPSLK